MPTVNQLVRQGRKQPKRKAVPSFENSSKKRGLYQSVDYHS